MKLKDSLAASAPEVEKLLGFPLKIPVGIRDIELGEVTINYSINKDLTTEKRQVDLIFSLQVIHELYLLKTYLNKEIGITVKLIENVTGKLFFLFLYFFYNPLSNEPWDLIDDEKVFDLIKSEGPISLRNTHIQNKIKSWLSDNSIANVKISKLGESLLEYASITPKKGRSQDWILRMIGKKLIKEVHKDFSSILKIAKKRREDYRPSEIRKFIMESAKIHMYSEEANYLKDDSRIFEMIIDTMLDHASKDKFKHEKWQESEVEEMAENSLLEFFEKIGPPKIISSCIEKHKELKEWFDTFRWDPHEMSREIIAKQLGVSEDTLINILYRKKKS